MFLRNHGSALKRNARKEQKAVKATGLDDGELIADVASSASDTGDIVATLMEQVTELQTEVEALKK